MHGKHRAETEAQAEATLKEVLTSLKFLSSDHCVLMFPARTSILVSLRLKCHRFASVVNPECDRATCKSTGKPIAERQ